MSFDGEWTTVGKHGKSVSSKITEDTPLPPYHKHASAFPPEAASVFGRKKHAPRHHHGFSESDSNVFGSSRRTHHQPPVANRKWTGSALQMQRDVLAQKPIEASSEEMFPSVIGSGSAHPKPVVSGGKSFADLMRQRVVEEEAEKEQQRLKEIEEQRIQSRLAFEKSNIKSIRHYVSEYVSYFEADEDDVPDIDDDYTHKKVDYNTDEDIELEDAVDEEDGDD